MTIDSPKVRKMAAGLIGIDVGSYAAKAVALENIKGSQATLAAIGMAGLSGETTLHWHEHPEAVNSAVGQAMKNLLKAAGFPNQEVAVALNSEIATIKKFTIPQTNRSEIDDLIEDEAERIIPFSLDEVYYSWHIMNPRSSSGFWEVLFVAAPKYAVDNYVRALKLAHLTASVIDVSGLALFNAYDFLNQGHSDSLVMVDLGASTTTVLLIKDGAVLSIGTERLGGRNLTEGIVNLFKVSYQNAEAIKMGAEEIPEPTELANLVVETTGLWRDAIERAIINAKAEEPGFIPRKILLSGGASLMEGLADEFESHFKTPVEVFNPLASLNYDQRKFDQNYIAHVGPQMAISFGLAIRNKGGVNL